MVNMCGKLLSSLSYHLDKEEDEWRAKNPYRRELAYSVFQRLLISLSDNPLKNSFELLLLASILMLGTWLHGDKITIHLPAKMDFSAIWSVQAAIVGVIYPIVISFVTFMLQRRHSAKASLQIYLHDSAGIFSGLSALFLVLLVAVQYAFLSKINARVESVWMLIDIVWFVINIIGTVWFLIRTFNFLQPAIKADITKKYAVNVIWPREVREHLQIFLYVNAPEQGLLPGSGLEKADLMKEPSVLFGSLGSTTGKEEIIAQIKGKRRISNVHFRLLNIVIKRWLVRAHNESKSTRKEKAFLGMREIPLLVFPVQPGGDYDGSTPLCRVEGDIHLRGWEQFLVQLAYSWEKSKGKLPKLTIQEMLADLESEARAAIGVREDVLFEETLDAFIDLHAALIKASAFTNSHGQQDNYAIVPDSRYALERPIHVEWSECYLSLFDVAVGQISSTKSYFEQLAFISRKLFMHLDKATSHKVLTNIITMQSVLFYYLHKWWVKTLEAQGQMKHNICAPASLNPPHRTDYEKALEYFVGSWETLKNYEFPPQYSELSRSWEELASYAGFYETHLNETFIDFFRSVFAGDEQAAEWLLDVIMNWSSGHEYRLKREHYLIRHVGLLTIEQIGKNWEEVKSSLGVEIISTREDIAPTAVFASCIKNLWVDACSIALYILIVWGKNCQCDKSLSVRMIIALLEGRFLKPGGDSLRVFKLFASANDVLLAIFRQFYADGTYRRGYRSKLDKLVERVSGFRSPSMVSGRVYSDWGVADLESVSDGQLLLLCLFVKPSWNPREQVVRFIRRSVVDDKSGLDNIEADLTKWKDRLASEDFSGYKDLFTCIQSKSGEKIGFEEALDIAKQSINNIITILQEIKEEQIAKITVTTERLVAIARWLSEQKIFIKSTDVPLALFNNTKYLPERHTEYSLIIKGMNKVDIMQAETQDKPFTDIELLVEPLVAHVNSHLMSDIVQKLVTSTVDASTAAAYWEQLKHWAAKIRDAGLKPLLFVENPTIPDWIWEWTTSDDYGTAKRPGDLQLSKDKNFEGIESYLGNFNDVPVFNAPIPHGSSCLLAKESLEEVCFTEFNDIGYVDITVQEKPGKKGLIDLKLVWSYDLKLKEYPAVRLKYK